MRSSVTVMTTVSGIEAVPSESVTTRMKVKVAALSGAVKVSETAALLFSITIGPSICVQP